MKFRKVLAPVLGTALLVPSMGMAVSAAETAPTETSGVELRTTLDSLLSEHYALAVDSMMKIYDGDAAAEAAMAALEANAADMEPVIASVYGEAGGEAFADIFEKHNTGTDEYAMAVKEGDEAAQEEALEQIQLFVDEMGAFLATATEGNLPEEGATAALRAHEDFVQDTFDQYAAGEYEAAYTTYLEGFEQIFGAGSAISGAIATQFPDKFTDPNTAAGDFRATVNRIAAEHFALAQLSMVKGFNGAADFDFADWAQDQNTQEFQAAIASFYGEEAGTQFAALWNNEHIAVQSELATAQAGGNDEEIQQAQTALIEAFASELGAFLSTATEERLPQEATIANIATHEQTVVDAFTQYTTDDFEASYDTYREGYTVVFAIGKGLSGAIVDQFPEKFETTVPDKMPATGLGGTSNGMNTMAIWVVLSTLILAAAGTITYRQSRQ